MLYIAGEHIHIGDACVVIIDGKVYRAGKQGIISMTETSNMPAYECHKTVWALQIASVGNYRPAGDGMTVRAITFDDASEREIGEAVFRRYTPVPGDFYVVYEDGYESFSPKDVFLSGYRPTDKRSFADIKAETKR